MNTIQQEGNTGFVIQPSFNHSNVICSGCDGIAKPCSVEKHLEFLLQRSEMAKKLYGLWICDKLRVGKMISLISSTPFQTFSDHGTRHSELLLSTIARVLGNRLCLLGATDAWAMLECAYRHDLGMYIDYRDIQDTLRNARFIKKIEEYLNDSN